MNPPSRSTPTDSGPSATSVPAGDLRAIVEQLADGVLIVDERGHIRFANPAAQRLFGRSQEELNASELGFPMIDRDVGEIEIVRSGGTTITAEIRVVHIQWEGEAAKLVSLRDVTDRIEAEERARQLNRERAARADAEAASQAKSDFLAMMSHELRTPLNAVIGYTDLLDLGIGGGALTPEQRHQLGRIRASGRHLLTLVDEVLDLSKIEAGRLTVGTGVGNAGITADAAIALVQARADEKGIRIVTRCAVDGDIRYDGDEDRVRQIIVNLVTNAVKFTETGGTITVECGSSDEPDASAQLSRRSRWAYVRVSDTGIGIPLDRQAQIFEPFVQGEAGHTRARDGAGLGLTISRRLARLMRGDLTVHSEPGKGSDFTLWLPVASDAKESTAVEANAVPTPVSVDGFGEIGQLLLSDLGAMVDAFVRRLREEDLVPAARRLRLTQLSDHLACHLADLASMLIAMEDTHTQSLGVMADTTEIQRTVSERHGRQRARLGWTERSLRREYALLVEELEQFFRRRQVTPFGAQQTKALGLVLRFLEAGEEIAVKSLLRTLAERRAERRAEGGGQRGDGGGQGEGGVAHGPP